ncbi:MAG: hypothetical protein A3G88_05465 [Omnitrophica WOR_2 bacterium RIFCSPLOWO2_12_FULL_63_16]|nr:MAG: hypothetical protein A3G88_05465 [Omnitrophica WOR_2 bacterium RIFCSPLOWO2_12_FULL_63_16]
MDLPLLLVVVASLSSALIVGRMTRGILFWSAGMDQETQVRAAARSRERRWPSDMHKYAQGKAWMKDVGVLGLAVMQRLLKDTQTERPLTVLALMINTVSAVLLFMVARIYWNTAVGLYVVLLYLGCFWPYQIVLLGGFQGLATMLLLGFVRCLQQVEGGAGEGVWWFVAAGALIGATMFASASGRKFLPLAWGAFLYSQRHLMAPLGGGRHGWESLAQGIGPALVAGVAVLAVAVSLFAMFRRVLFRRLVAAIYFERAPGALNRLIKARAQQPLEEYLRKEGPVTWGVTALGAGLVGYLVLCVALTRAASFYLAHGLILTGFCLAVLFFAAPDVVWNVKGYLSYWQAAARWTHYPLYKEFFATVGRTIRPGEMRLGPRWLLPFFWRTVPFHLVAYLLSLGTMLYVMCSAGREPYDVWETAGIALLSLSPILYGELTHSPQCSRPYFPALLGILLAIGHAGFLVEQRLPPEARLAWWGGAVALAGISAGWNLWVFLTDLWPARMAATWLNEALKSRGIHAFSTYDTPYNKSFLGVWPPQLREQFEIRYLRTLREVADGYVVVPSTSSKSFDMSTDDWAITHGDFDVDPELNRLLESKAIARYAVASFKTVASSRMWVQEHDVTSYRDLILKEVGELDRRWRGRAWILDGKRLAADLAHRPSPVEPSGEGQGATRMLKG